MKRLKRIKWRRVLGTLLTWLPLLFFVVLQFVEYGWLDALVFILIVVVLGGCYLGGDWLRNSNKPKFVTHKMYIITDAKGDLVDASTNSKHVIESLTHMNRIGYVLDATRVKLTEKKGESDDSKQSD